MNLIEFMTLFPDDASAEQFFTERRWPNGVLCPYCDGDNVRPHKHKTMHHYCRDCRRAFSVRTGTAMQSSRLGYQKWALGMFLFATRKKGVSSYSLADDLGITQKSAWYMLHRIRAAYETGHDLLTGTVEADETYIGGQDKNRHYNKKRGRGSQTPVIGARERETGRVTAKRLQAVDTPIVEEWLENTISEQAKLFTDGASVYKNRTDGVVYHNRKEYVRGDVHTNGIESFWALLKRGYHGTYHHFSDKHLARYLSEFTVA